MSYTANNLVAKIQKAYHRIEDRISNTELIRLPWLDAPNRKVWGKLECKQVTGSFKARGAFNAILQIPEQQPIITYSAGNHGLAVAYVAQLLGRSCTIFVPSNASEIKLRKLKKYGIDVESVGEDLYESGLFAQERAQQTGAALLTPFSTPEIVSGQGTIGLELTEQLPTIDSLIVPLGGGGLLTGVGAAIKAQSPQTQIIAAYPNTFDRVLEAHQLPRAMARKVMPTIADGLAVQVEEDCWLLPLIEQMTARYLPISEEDMFIAIYSLLRQESLLVEGAGSIGIAALLNDPNGEQISGNTVVLLTGSNMSPALISQSLGVNVKEDRLRVLLGLKEVAAQGELPSKEILRTPRPLFRKEKKLNHGLKSSVSIWYQLTKNLHAHCIKGREKVDYYLRFACSKKLRFDEEAIHQLIADLQQLEERICQNLDREWTAENLWEMKQKYRMNLNRYGGLMALLEWASPSYDQSLEPMFFEPSVQLSNIVNYDRYGSINLREFEIRLQGIIGLNDPQLTLISSSSGQAAYQIIESFLLREVFGAKGRMVYANYTYFESLEQMINLPSIEVERFEGYDLVGLIRFVEERQAQVVFIDPVANIQGMPVYDLKRLAQLLRSVDWSDKWLVIDGTMISGGLNPFAYFNAPNHPNVIYYESGSKYIQFGLDIQMMGFCVVDKKWSHKLVRNRRNSGSTLYKRSINYFPIFDRQTYLDRMRLLTHNVSLLIAEISTEWKGSGAIKIGFPANWKALGWDHAGGVFTIEFCEAGLNNRDKLNTFIEELLQRCQEHQIAMTKGVSFGFYTTRVSAASAMAGSTDPFLRFSVSEETTETIRELAAIINKCIGSYLQKNSYGKTISMGARWRFD